MNPDKFRLRIFDTNRYLYTNWKNLRMVFR